MTFNRIWILFSAAVLGAVCIGVFLLIQPRGLPKIQGVIIPEAREIENFSLVSHHDKTFTNADLLGRWYLVSYGFTDCPDICPTVLSQLAQVEKRLQERGQFDDLQVLFYTVDPARDTVEHLSNYVEFFSNDFIGLTWGLELQTNHAPFERSLGMLSSIDPLPAEEAAKDYKGYGVSHGVMLYLVNPEGKLQAILKPEISDHGMHYFTVDKIYRDYLAIRAYFG